MNKLSIFTFVLIVFSINSNALTFKEQTHRMAKKGHSPLSYTQVKSLMFSTVDNIEGLVCSVYTPSQCQKRYYRDAKSSHGFKLNIEHTWPQSKGAKEMPANSDMHHLFVTSKESNGKRANHPFCDSVYSYWDMDGSVYGFDKYSQDCFEVQDAHKGNTARAIFYFSVRYLLPLDSEQESVLRRWHKQDPVDDRELVRNNIIRKLQGNTNPFISGPNLVDQITDF